MLGYEFITDENVVETYERMKMTIAIVPLSLIGMVMLSVSTTTVEALAVDHPADISK